MRNKQNKIYTPCITTFGIGEAIKFMRNGHAVARKGWNGRNICLRIQKPDKNSLMTQEYIYIDTTHLQSFNRDAVKGKVPWVASQTDLLAEDYVIMEVAV